MSTKFDRFFNPQDGTYANVPIIPVHAEKFRGKRPFGKDVLIGNWYEDLSKFKESAHRSKSFYQIDYPAHAGSVPDTVLRRKIRASQDERPARMILEHHDIDDEKQMISSYDEQYSRRGPYGDFRDTSERRWALQDNYWLPERNDHPLEGPPTTWGLLDKKRSQSQCIRRQRTTPEISEYTNRYVPHRSEAYLASRRPNIPRIYTTAVDRSDSFNPNPSYRSVSDFTRRPPITPDPMEIDHICSVRSNTNIPRSYFYLGSLSDHLHRRMQKNLPNLTESTNLASPLTSSVEQFSSQEQQQQASFVE